MVFHSNYPRKNDLHHIWIHWMMQCIKTISYSFLINNVVSGKVIPPRGIQQGDPLFPYIFILCGEVLSGLCKKAQSDGSLAGIRVARHCRRINHLLFADDTMIFTYSNSHCSCSDDYPTQIRAWIRAENQSREVFHNLLLKDPY